VTLRTKKRECVVFLASFLSLLPSFAVAMDLSGWKSSYHLELSTSSNLAAKELDIAVVDLYRWAGGSSASLVNFVL